MKLADSWTNYNLYFHELTSKTSDLIFEDDKVEVYTIPLNHRIYTNGYLFKEKEGLRKLKMNAVEDANINVAYYRKLTQGFDVENEDGAKEAASIAKQANVGTLILGHYSTRYGSIKAFKDEAKGVFDNVQLAEDGKTFDFT